MVFEENIKDILVKGVRILHAALMRISRNVAMEKCENRNKGFNNEDLQTLLRNETS